MKPFFDNTSLYHISRGLRQDKFFCKHKKDLDKILGLICHNVQTAAFVFCDKDIRNVRITAFSESLDELFDNNLWEVTLFDVLFTYKSFELFPFDNSFTSKSMEFVPF